MLQIVPGEEQKVDPEELNGPGEEHKVAMEELSGHGEELNGDLEELDGPGEELNGEPEEFPGGRPHGILQIGAAVRNDGKRPVREELSSGTGKRVPKQSDRGGIDSTPTKGLGFLDLCLSVQ